MLNVNVRETDVDDLLEQVDIGIGEIAVGDGQILGLKRSNSLLRGLVGTTLTAEPKNRPTASLLSSCLICLTERQPLNYEVMVPMGEKEAWWLFRLNPKKSPDGKVSAIVVTAVPITDGKLREGRLKALSVAVEQNFSAIYITDDQGTVEYANPAFSRMTGYENGEVVGSNPRMMKTGLLTPDYYQKMWSELSAGRRWKAEFPNKKKNGELYWESSIISPIHERGKVTHYVAVMEDITELKESQEKLATMASTDSLTETFNRRTGMRILKEAMETAYNASSQLTIAYLDINDLKSINDAFGHRSGDELIISFARHLQGRLRKTDSLCRMGGDEFMAIFPGASRHEIEILISQIRTSFRLEGERARKLYPTTFSFGIGEYFPVLESSVDQFISAADEKMYQDKRRTRTRK